MAKVQLSSTTAEPRRSRFRLDSLPRIRHKAAGLIRDSLTGDRPAAEVRDLVAALAIPAGMVQTAPAEVANGLPAQS
jgi:hypothetical protein